MIVITPGHEYHLANHNDNGQTVQVLQFVEKVPARPDSTVLKVKVDGTTNEEVLAVMVDRMQFLQDKMPCEENAEVIKLLTQCQDLLYKRTLNRQSRGVEGKHEE